MRASMYSDWNEFTVLFHMKLFWPIIFALFHDEAPDAAPFESMHVKDGTLDAVMCSVPSAADTLATSGPDW